MAGGLGSNEGKKKFKQERERKSQERQRAKREKRGKANREKRKQRELKQESEENGNRKWQNVLIAYTYLVLWVEIRRVFTFYPTIFHHKVSSMIFHLRRWFLQGLGTYLAAFAHNEMQRYLPGTRSKCSNPKAIHKLTRNKTKNTTKRGAFGTSYGERLARGW